MTYDTQTLQGLFEYIYELPDSVKIKYESGVYFYPETQIKFENFIIGFESALKIFEIKKSPN